MSDKFRLAKPFTCPKHKSYKAIRPPLADCMYCHMIWVAVQKLGKKVCEPSGTGMVVPNDVINAQLHAAAVVANRQKRKRKARRQR